MDSILGVEAGPIDEIESAAHGVSSGECGAVWLAGAGAAEAVTIISVISVTLLVPARQSVHVHPLGGETDSHVAVPALAHDPHLEVVEATGGRDRVGGSH